MKKVTVSAVVPENKEKGTKEMTASVIVDYPDNLDEAKKMFGEEAMLSNALANWRVTLQGNIRAGLKRGESPTAISARLATAKMGVAATGGKVDALSAYAAIFAAATPEKQAEMLAELKKKAAESK